MSLMNHTKTVDHGDNLKAEAGLWVDHREALIVVISKTGEETKRIQSNVQKQLRRTGEPSVGRFEYQEVPADDSRQRAYSGYLERYYEEIVAYLRHAGAILIFGPGEAKGKLKKRFAKECPGAHIVVMETTDKMTEPQIVAHVRQHFESAAAKQGT